MGRPHRIDTPSALHHVTGRGNAGLPIFSSDEDRDAFLGISLDVSAGAGWSVLAYCLMANHYHLVLETPDGGLARGMHLLACRYVRRRHARHGTRGRVFGERYWSTVIRDAAQLAATIRYVVMNPVAAELVQTPGAWIWSSHRAVVHEDGTLVAGRRLLELLGGSDPSRAYRELVGDGDERIPAPRKIVRLPQLAEILADGSGAAIRAAVADGYSLRAIGVELGLSAATVHRRLREG